MPTLTSDLSRNDARVIFAMRAIVIPGPCIVPREAFSSYAFDEREAMQGFLKAIDRGARRRLNFYLGSACAPTADERACLSLLADGQIACQTTNSKAWENVRRRAEWLVRQSSVYAVADAACEAAARLVEGGVYLSPPLITQLTLKNTIGSRHDDQSALQLVTVDERPENTSVVRL